MHTDGFPLHAPCLNPPLESEPPSPSLRRSLRQAVYTCYAMHNLGKRHRKGMKKGANPVFAIDTWSRLLQDSGFFTNSKVRNGRMWHIHTDERLTEAREKSNHFIFANFSKMKRQDCKLVYLMSRMLVVDEYHRDKEGALAFVDFLEVRLFFSGDEAWRVRIPGGSTATT